MKSYQIDIYHESPDKALRYTLGKKGSRPLIAIGLNPSTADDKKPDITISKIMGFAERNGFDGFVMLNLYPHRATFPKNLPDELNSECHTANIQAILNCLAEFSEVNILAVWGEPIKTKKYLPLCLAQINEAISGLNANWWQIGDMTKSGHPRHPSRAAYTLGINKLCIASYLSTVQN